jgi:glycosyltransferase involved in cell wall biosynthesis
MKKVIIFARYLECGGTEKALISLLKAIDYSKYDVTLKLFNEGDFYINEVPKEVKISRFKFKNVFCRAIFHRGKVDFMSRLFRKSWRILNNIKSNGWYDSYMRMMKYSEDNEEEYDLALDFNGYGYFLTTYLAEKIKAKKKATWMHDENLHWIKDMEPNLSKYDKVFCVSKAVKEEFDRLCPKYKNKSEIFYNIIDIDEIIKKAELFVPDFKKDCYNIVTVGRLAWQKGYEVAINAAYELKKKNFNFCWYFVGDGEEKESYEKMIAKLDLTNNIILLGKQKNPYPYVKCADIYVQPSRHEGYGITVLEARILKKIILASDLLPFREQIVNDVNGYLIENQPKLYAEKIIDIYNGVLSTEHIKESLEKEKIDFSSEIQKFYDM